ncbi:MAG: 50S ribosomal protein L22 [candidate division Zixibacteria bacterium]|nr:50S ribosomal protein L22 [candidate division Zixibacteria bacterium]
MAQDIQQRVRRDSILNKIQELDSADRKKVIKTQARRSRIKEEYVGHTLSIFNGQDYTNVHITSDMIGRTLGKVAPRITPTACSKFLSIPPRKMRQVGSLVVGLPVEKALDVLNFTPKIAAHHMAKTLKAAVANKLSVEGTANLDPEHLYVSQIVVNPGPSAKRIQYRSMGRVYRLRKRFCHLDIYLDINERKQREAEALAETKAKKGKAKKTAKKKTVAKKAPAKKKAAAKKATTKKTAVKKTAAKKTTAKKSSNKTAGQDKKK